MNPIALIIVAPALGVPTNSTDAIVVTAAREPQVQRETPASSTLIEADEIERLNLPLASDLLRLVPGVAVAVSGPAGSQAQIRIRGAEASHSLLFVDGIRFNDPAAGNEARFELLASDSLSRIEVVRGPQSALWGSEAMGGVIAVETADARRASGVSALGEYGSLDTMRASAQLGRSLGDLAVSGSLGWIKSDGIDSFDNRGERDGFRNLTAAAKAIYSISDSSEVGLVGHWVSGKSEFDGFDPATFLRADTLDSTENRIAAGRVWTRIGFGNAREWSFTGGVSILDSANRNHLDDDPVNRTSGRRWTFNGQLSRNLEFGRTKHRLTIAAERQDEDFTARDQQYFGATDQDRSRRLTAFAGEFRSEWSDLLVTDLALRRDDFSTFADATTFRASLLLRPAIQWRFHAAYGEGIAQPSFYDLFGFFPGSFVGNTGLRPERSRSWEAGVTWADDRTSIAVAAFAGRLQDEIIDVYNPETFLSTTANAGGRSRRRGIEVEARHRVAEKGLIAASYTYLDADQQQAPEGAVLREVRRPRHSASLLGTWTVGRVELGASLAYVGERPDTDVDSRPARDVKLQDYLLGSLNIGWQLRQGVTAYVRGENLFDANYQDVFGYQTAGRTIHAGLRLRLGT